MPNVCITMSENNKNPMHRIGDTEVKLVIVLKLKTIIYMVLIITPDILPPKIKFDAILRTKDNLA